MHFIGTLLGYAFWIGLFYLLVKGAVKYRENAEAPRKGVDCPRCGKHDVLKAPTCGNCHKLTRLIRVVGKNYNIAGTCKACKSNIPLFPECSCGCNLAGLYFDK
jgi:predicted nucleic-acid-binding Zn-ribbon protein